MYYFAGCGSDNEVLLNSQPAFVAGTVQRATFDGSTNDLLTAGLGKTGLQSAVSPTIGDALNPTAAELRRLRSTTTTAPLSTPRPVADSAFCWTQR